jgi:hypothetical protein
MMPLTFGRDILDEGEFVQLVCIVSKGDEPLRLTWSLKGDDVSSEPGLTTTALGTRTSMLTINSVGYRHSGTYTCRASNDAGTTTQSAELKVNGSAREEKDEKHRVYWKCLENSVYNDFGANWRGGHITHNERQ